MIVKINNDYEIIKSISYQNEFDVDLDCLLDSEYSNEEELIEAIYDEILINSYSKLVNPDDVDNIPIEDNIDIINIGEIVENYSYLITE